MSNAHSGAKATMKTSSSSMKPEVTVSPAGHLLVDDELQIRIQGLDSGQEVTVHTGINVLGRTMESCCQFRADRRGEVDLYSHPSLAGSYTGVSPMGIFWSMMPTPDMQRGLRIIIKRVDIPVTATLAVYPGTCTAEEIRMKKLVPMVTHVIERWYQGQGVTRVPVKYGRIRGTLFLPPGPGPFPGVVDIFGTAGGLMEFRAALLASRGVASFALAYFMHPDLPDSILDADLDYFLEAIEWLRSHPRVYSEGVGLVGRSRGANLSFIIAAHCPRVRALVSVNGCTFNAKFPLKFSGGDIPAIPMAVEKMEKNGDVLASAESLRNMYDERDLIPVWRHNPKVLNIVGEDDRSWPIECVHLLKKHYPVDKVDNFTIRSYPGAGHLIEPPYTPLCSLSYHKAYGMYFLWGGTPRPHAAAEEDSWKHILDFLHTNIPTTRREHSKL